MKLAIVQYARIKVLKQSIKKNNIQLKPLLFTVVKWWVPRGASGVAPHQPHLFHAISMVVPVVKSIGEGGGLHINVTEVFVGVLAGKQLMM